MAYQRQMKKSEPRFQQPNELLSLISSKSKKAFEMFCLVYEK